MKIKEGNDKISLEKLPVIFFAVTAVSVILRTLQMFKFIDHSTGFYTGGTAITVVLYVVIGVSCLFFAVASFLSSESKKIDLQLQKNSALVAITVIFAVSFLYDSISSFSASFMAMGTESADSAFRSMMLSGTIPKFFQSVFAFFSAIYFFILAKGFIKCDSRIAKHKILAIAPVGWAGFRIIHRFVEQISYIKISELFLELILLALMIMFFMAFAQVASGVYSKGFRWRITGLGLPAALIGLTLNCARLVYSLVSGAGALNGDYPYSIADFIFALFVTVLVITLINENKTKEIEEE